MNQWKTKFPTSEDMSEESVNDGNEETELDSQWYSSLPIPYDEPPINEGEFAREKTPNGIIFIEHKTSPEAK
ncbi:hypothetical protein AB6A40_000177 [Gnathostoma spinigerum]|uniref:Uncharacterized protein n=1 Tax=Gnathostoma spinigerum TaxID=75299 RepID=A0ABD6E9R9_9BILA